MFPVPVLVAKGGFPVVAWEAVPSGAGLCPAALFNDLDPEIPARRWHWFVFDREGVGRWVKLELIVVEDRGHGHHQLNLGDAGAQTGVVA